MLRKIFRTLSPLLANRDLYIIRSLSLRAQEQLLPPNFDYVRHATLGLLAEEILDHDIPGDIAELGVYQGDFARHLNQLFPQRKLYLFDTFKGFDDQDIQNDQQLQYSSGEQNFSNTSIEAVIKKMPHPDQCIIKKGHFPESGKEVDAQFCLVSIDVDLYDPILAGLSFFYPKLAKGGYIIVHDYNNDEYKGVRQAVQKYCKANHISYMPIPDGCGSIVIAK